MKAARSGAVEVKQEQEGMSTSADVEEEEVPF
jgi:hypothetical protein